MGRAALCEIAGARWDDTGERYNRRRRDKPVCQWSTDGEMIDAASDDFALSKEVQSKLVSMNDGRDSTGTAIEPKSFEEIADWIEQNVPAEQASAK